MRREDISGLFCLSCVLFFFYVNSQNGCPAGWFGSECKYKCRCTDDKCDPSGACVDSYTCKGGWFGPACQYADLAYNTSNKEVFTDGIDTTCTNATGDNKLIILLNGSSIFTWLRVHVTDQASDALSKLQLTLSQNETLVDCPDLKMQTVDDRTLDMHCISEDDINTVTLNGEAVSRLCSVYVSGGRNVALKEKAEHGVTYSKIEDGVKTSYRADLAVDGNTNPDFASKTCSNSGNLSQHWSLFLSKPRSVHRYVLYNRAGSYIYRLIGFHMESFNHLNQSSFDYKDPSKVGRVKYTITHLPKAIQSVGLTTNNTDAAINICEFEVYGDSICDSGRFGFECEKSCHCLNNQTCYVITGRCPSGCSAGFVGESCETTCKVGTFGANCNTMCSQECKPTGDPSVTPCDMFTGNCVKGCQPGYRGDLCTAVCEAGMFGDNCSTACSKQCKPTGDPNMSPCNISTGDCVSGCQLGFTGDHCSVASVETTSAMDLLPIAVGVCLLFAAIAFFGYCFCKKRTAPPSAERKSASVQPELLK